MNAPIPPANLLEVEYKQTGKSKTTDSMGMREMQARAYDKRSSQHLLLKSPPASGKSRALMFIALDKLINQGIQKVIVSVPEMSIGRSFTSTDLTSNGFFADWVIEDRYNLCLVDGSDSGKVAMFKEFVEKPYSKDNNLQILLCTHQTFRFGFDSVVISEESLHLFDNTLLAIDEFHHVAAAHTNRLGAILDAFLSRTTAHVIAMTGSYFRGDQVPILTDEDESKFTKVTYSYYEQLNGYQYLKSLGLGYHFYKDSFFNALTDCLDTHLKTIVHIPSVTSMSAEADKYETVNKIIDIIGEYIDKDPGTGIMRVKTEDGRILKVADLVDDNSIRRSTQKYLSELSGPDDIDIIIALGMAKEGFDWEYCEHVLTIGYRGSLTEVVQIIGRATRDAPGKLHAQFTNLIAEPDANKSEVESSVNDLLKAITLSLLMEQVLKPNINFKRRSDLEFLSSDKPEIGTIVIDDTKTRPSDKVMDILNQDKEDILAQLYQKPDNAKKFLTAEEAGLDPEALSTQMLKEVFKDKYPDLSEVDVYQAIDAMMYYMTVNANGGVVDITNIPDEAEVEGERAFVKQDGKYVDVTELEEQLKPEEKETIKERHMPENVPLFDPKTQTTEPFKNRLKSGLVEVGNKFINVNELPVNLVASVNPFHDAYEVLSRVLDKSVLSTISSSIGTRNNDVSEDEAVIMWPKVVSFKKENGVEPNPHSSDPIEVRMAQVLRYVRAKLADNYAKQNMNADK